MPRSIGEITWTGPSGVLHRDMQRCTHCGGSWVVDPLGPERGFCRKCYGPTCDRRGCVVDCLHWEKEMERKERGGVSMRCGHCHTAWTPEPGSGKTRGWCLTCSATLCGRAECRTHEDRLPLYQNLVNQVNEIARL